MITAFLDTETGGLNPSQHALLEVGLHFPSNPIRDLSLAIWPDPSLQITEQSMKVNGYPRSYEGRERHTESEALQLVTQRLKEINPKILVCHNAPFDTAFLKFSSNRSGIALQLPRTFCTMSMGAALNALGGFSEDRDVPSLDFLLKELCPGYVRPNPHRAVDDAKATALVYQAMIDRLHFAANLLAATPTPHETISPQHGDPQETPHQKTKHSGFHRGWRNFR